MHSIVITAECVAEIPSNQPYNDIEEIYYDIQTEEGLFRDTKEITSSNVLEYMMGGNKVVTSVFPSANDYKNFFAKMLEKYDEVIHICVSSGISEAHSNAELARAKLGKNSANVHIFDSKTISAAQSMIVMEAARYRDEGKNAKEIIEHIKKYAERIELSYLADNADYLYYNHRVSKTVKNLCNMLRLHPVLFIDPEGKMALRGVSIGNLNKCRNRLIRKTLRKADKIDSRIGYIIYVGCSEDHLNIVRQEVEKRIDFDVLYEEPASATVSCNCGPNTIGLIYARKE